MEIQPEALKKIASATINGQKLAQLFEQLAQATEAAGGTSNSFTIDYQDTVQEVNENTWIPQVILVLRPA